MGWEEPPALLDDFFYPDLCMQSLNSTIPRASHRQENRKSRKSLA